MFPVIQGKSWFPSTCPKSPQLPNGSLCIGVRYYYGISGFEEARTSVGPHSQVNNTPVVT